MDNWGGQDQNDKNEKFEISSFKKYMVLKLWSKNSLGLLKIFTNDFFKYIS